MTVYDYKEFSRFLKEHGAYALFIKRVIKNHYSHNFKKYCVLIDRGLAISHAFSWVHTPEGDMFWRKLSEIWYTRNYQY